MGVPTQGQVGKGNPRELGQVGWRPAKERSCPARDLLMAAPGEFRLEAAATLKFSESLEVWTLA